jgi:hypothetical protein
MAHCRDNTSLKLIGNGGLSHTYNLGGGPTSRRVAVVGVVDQGGLNA